MSRGQHRLWAHPGPPPWSRPQRQWPQKASSACRLWGSGRWGRHWDGDWLMMGMAIGTAQPTHPTGFWSALAACGAAPCPGAAAPSPLAPAPPPAPSASRRTRCAPPPSGCEVGGSVGVLPAAPSAPLPPQPCLRVKKHVVLRAHPHGLPDAVDIGADIPAQDVGSAGGGGQQPGQDGPGEEGVAKWRWQSAREALSPPSRELRGDGAVLGLSFHSQIPAHMVVVLPAPLWPRKEVICPS